MTTPGSSGCGAISREEVIYLTIDVGRPHPYRRDRHPGAPKYPNSSYSVKKEQQ